MDVLRTLRDGAYHAVVVDPPYGMDYQSKSRRFPMPKILNDQRPFIWFLYDAFRVARPDAALLCFCIGRTQEAFRSAIEIAGWKVRSQVVWDRVVHGMGDTKTMFAPRHDVAWFATKGRFAFTGGRPKSVLRHQKVLGRDLRHPTQKPVDLMMGLIRYIAPERGHVLDPCMGSGSTGVAAIRLGRRFTGIEMDRGYYRVAVRRIREELAG